MIMDSNKSESSAPSAGASAPSDFIRDIVAAHVRENKYPRIHTRFPPEPNGYLHIGHAKSICLNFGIAREFGGVCNLRMDDTNPTKEDVEYVDSITEDVKWLISAWADDRLGLKPKGKTPEAQDGQRQAGLFPARPNRQRPAAPDRLEPFYASDYFDQIYEYALAARPEGRGLRVTTFPPRTPTATAARRTAPARTAPSAPAPSRRTSTCSRG